MSELLKLIQDADLASLEMERAKSAVDLAKSALENAKESLEFARKAFDEILVRADEIGVPRPKVRKLIEERTGSLMASGLLGTGFGEDVSAPKAAKISKPKKSKSSETESSDAEKSDFDFEARYPESAAGISLS